MVGEGKGAGAVHTPASPSLIVFGGGANALVGVGAVIPLDPPCPGAASIIASSVGKAGTRASARWRTAAYSTRSRVWPYV